MGGKVVLGPVVIASLVFQVSLAGGWHSVVPGFHLFFLVLIGG